MLYQKNSQSLASELFKNPTSEYRGTPFWAWNTVLNANDLTWQIEQFKQMGFGGFHMHSRVGMATEYLSDSFMDLVKTCVEKARAENMLAWLYDEDRWPSGAAGGLVTKDYKYRARYLLLTRTSDDKKGKLLTCFEISLDENGALKSYKQISTGTKIVPVENNFLLYAYEGISADDPWFNNQGYVDTLNPEAIAKFIEITYERYKDAVGADFGDLVPAMFTDEPQFIRKHALGFAQDESDVTLPWTPDLPDTFQQEYDSDLLSSLPELLWDLPDGRPSLIRYRYHDHIAERFAQAFADQCGNWCEKHGLALTGHMMDEPSLHSQTIALGETMRSYRSFQLPGIDMLCDNREFTTAKQAQSAARQYNRPGVMSELYGVTNWDYDFRGHKLQGDWQAALGVTVRVPHLSWVSMNGEAKRDYPSTFNYQVPWYKEYPYIEDHFARVNTVMTRGRAVCNVGVIHPVESYWLHWGAEETTAAIRQQMDDNFQNITEWLLKGCIDFDFISESLLPSQCGEISNKFPVGAMNYDVIIVPELETIRATTLERLSKFANMGGRVIFVGSAPKYVDATPDTRGHLLYDRCEQVNFNKAAILTALQNVREVEIRNADGVMTDNFIYQLREDGDNRWLFIANADNPINPDIPAGQIMTIKLRGHFTVTHYDSLTGATSPLPARTENGITEIVYPFYEHDSLLLKLEPGENHARLQEYKLVDGDIPGKTNFLHPIPVTLHEPNVLLLDMAEYSLNGEPYRSTEEILRLDNILREEIGWPPRRNSIAQPWVENDTTTPHTLQLRYTINSDVAVSDAYLALENAAIAEVKLNGQLAGNADGWYVDKCIGKVKLPNIKPGKNILEVKLPYGRKIDVEACYLLGDFGVHVVGCHTKLISPVRELHFGDIVHQGLPFYGGNLTYHLEADIAGNTMEIAASCYRGHLLRVAVDGKDAGVIAFSPYRVKVDGLTPGKHKVDVTYFGSRVNTFGQLHRRASKTAKADNGNCLPWWGPDSWRTTGNSWSYEYVFWQQGILKSVEVF